MSRERKAGRIALIDDDAAEGIAAALGEGDGNLVNAGRAIIPIKATPKHVVVDWIHAAQSTINERLAVPWYGPVS